MGGIYCSEQDVRNLTGLTTSEISDDLLSGIISHATVQLNADIQTSWSNEGVGYISSEKENTINGSNTKFYTKHYPIGDRDNNGVISGVDVYVYTIDSTGARSQIIVSGITSDEGDPASKLGGPLWLASAPESGDKLYFSYFSSPVDMETPHPLVKLACIQLSAALSFTKIDVRKVQSFSVGKIRVMRQSDAYNIYDKMYTKTINKIRQEIFMVAYGTKTL